jgi:hypothetical protein
VYEAFLAQVDDYELVAVDDLELEEVLWGYLNNARMEFATYNKDLVTLDKDKKEFAEDLTPVEILMYGKAMLIKWIDKQRSSLELTRKAIGDRDFNATQGYNYLETLTATSQKVKRELHQDMNIYEYADADAWGSLLNG